MQGGGGRDSRAGSFQDSVIPPTGTGHFLRLNACLRQRREEGLPGICGAQEHSGSEGDGEPLFFTPSPLPSRVTVERGQQWD